MAILTESQLERLKKHKYCAEGRSLTEFIFQPYWNWVVTLMPLWVAPNLITIVGLALNVVTALAVILYSPQANSTEVISAKATNYGENIIRRTSLTGIFRIIPTTLK